MKVGRFYVDLTGPSPLEGVEQDFREPEAMCSCA